MGQLCRILALGAMLALSTADVFTLSLGEIGQYSASLEITPTMTGSRVLFTEAASPNGGVDVVLSEELQANIQKAINNNCNSIDPQCIDSIKSLLVNPHTELESRQAVAFAVGAWLFLFIALALPSFDRGKNQGIPIALHIPSAQLVPAASAAKAPTVAAILNSGAPFVTITQKPDTTTVAGPDKPSQTTLSSAQDGHMPGDVAIYLSDDLAKRINEMIQRTQQCTAKGSPSNAKGIPMKGLTDETSAIICSAQSLVLNASPGAPFADLASFQGKQPAWSSPDMVEAMMQVVTYAVTQASYLKINVADATTLAFVSFYLSFVVIKGKTPLGKVNWISGTDLKGTVTESSLPRTTSVSPTMVITATSTPSSSSSMLECSASCAMIGNIRDCKTWCPTPTDESYIRPSQYAVKTVAFERWTVPIQVPVQVPIGICPPPPNNATDFPLDQFATVYSKFCAQADKSTGSTTWIVNAQGEQAGPKSHLLRFASREEPANTDKYKDYRFTLVRYIREGEKRSCSTSCVRAFGQLGLQDMCKRGDDKKAIASTGILDAGCASYSFSIETPQPPEVKPEITCGDQNSQFSAPKYDSSASDATSVESAIKRWCTDNDQFKFDYTTSVDDIYGRWDITQLGVPKRSSFWPHAKLHGLNKKGVVVKEQCVAAYTESLKQCDPGSDRTHGFDVLVGSTNYSLELSGWTQEGNPPWAQKTYFPPSEFEPRFDFKAGMAVRGKTYAPECDTGKTSDPVHTPELDKALDAFCVNGAELKGFGTTWDKMFRYPPKGQPRFYESQRVKLFLQLGAAPLKQSGNERPYFSENACDGYDWKMGADDCRYAMRKIFDKCNNLSDRFNGGEYKYRCVHYKVFDTNEE